MKNFLNIKLLFPALVLTIFFVSYSSAGAYWVRYFTDKSECWVTDGEMHFKGTKVTFAGGGVGCLVNKTVYSVHTFPGGGPDGGPTGDTGKFVRMVNYFGEVYPSFASTSSLR